MAGVKTQKSNFGHVKSVQKVKKKVTLEVRMVPNKKGNGWKIRKKWIHEVIE